MPDRMIDKILRNPRAYKLLYQAQDDFNTIFGGGGIRGYLLKRRYFKRFKHSRVCIGAPLDDPQLNIAIGRYSSASNPIAVVYVPAKDKKYEISIGSFVRIGPDLNLMISKVHTPEFVSNSLNNILFDRRGVELYKKHCKESYGAVHIGNDVWIGDGVVMIGNVNVGDGAVIGARSVVTHNVEPYSVVAGVPAKRIKYRFSKPVIKALLRIKWWDWDEKKILDNLEDFYDVEKFAKKYG